METFYGVQQPPVLMNRIRELGYELALFAAPGFGTPTEIERTVFAGIPGLPGERRDLGPVERNRAVTEDWLAWLDLYDRSRPFFGFLYYDPPMGEVTADLAEALPMDERFTANAEAKQSWRKYRLSARFIDGELGRVLESLRIAQRLDDTVVVVAQRSRLRVRRQRPGLHGPREQLQRRAAARHPGDALAGTRAARVYRHRSSHYDLPVTLLQDALGCSGDPADYAVGRNLFAGQDWDWIIAASYNSHAILGPDTAIVTHPGGFVEVLGPDYRPVRGADLDTRVVAEAMSAMRRFYR